MYCEKSVVLPGDSVKVTAKMKTVGYTGWMVRQIDVYASGQDSPVSLSFSAYIPMPIDAMKAKYYYKLCDDVFVNAPAVYVGNVYKGSSVTGTVEIVNFSEDEKAISFDADSEAILIGTVSRLSSKKPEQIKVVYEFTEGTKKWGVDTVKIELKIEDRIIELDVVANVIPYPKPVRTKLRPKAFSASTEMKYSNAGEVKSFIIRNIGSGNLNILEVKASENVHVERYDSLILPSADGKLHFKLTEMMSEEESIEVLTDDPFTPILYYKIKSRY